MVSGFRWETEQPVSFAPADVLGNAEVRWLAPRIVWSGAGGSKRAGGLQAPPLNREQAPVPDEKSKCSPAPRLAFRPPGAA